MLILYYNLFFIEQFLRFLKNFLNSETITSARVDLFLLHYLTLSIIILPFLPFSNLFLIQ
jgi:hypothetical protein